MVDAGGMSVSPRKRRFSDSGITLRRIRALALAAAPNLPDPHYLDPGYVGSGHFLLITERQREKVVKYINELAEDFELCVQTGGLACNYFDRYAASLTREPSRFFGEKRHGHVQMIASTCLLLAAKFFDRRLPPLSELSKVHHGKVSPAEFATLELEILERLRWKLHTPLPHAFTQHMVKLCWSAPFTPTIEERMAFFMDLSVYGYRFLSYPPAAIAAASLITAWTFSEAVVAINGHVGMLADACDLPEEGLRECVKEMIRYYQMCFPDAAKHVVRAALFIPIQTTREDSPATVSAEVADAAISPETVPPETPTAELATCAPLPAGPKSADPNRLRQVPSPDSVLMFSPADGSA